MDALSLISLFLVGFTAGMLFNEWVVAEPTRKVLRLTERYWAEGVKMNAKLLHENVNMKLDLPQKSPIQL